MNDSSSHARQWLTKAKNDLVAGERLTAAGGPYDAVCFHAQQAAEKALKALLAFAQAPIPHTHNLEDLQAACVQLTSVAVPARLASWELAELTPFAVESRYDVEFSPDELTAREGSRWPARYAPRSQRRSRLKPEA
jgi:HEPN domain-containing protein